MARRSKAKGRAKPARETKATSKKRAAVAEVEVVEEEAGMGLADGMTLMTTIMLLAACLMTDYLLGKHYDAGLFF